VLQSPVSIFVLGAQRCRHADDVRAHQTNLAYGWLNGHREAATIMTAQALLGFARILANGQGVAPSSSADGAICAYLHSQESREHMKIPRFARNVILVGLAWRLIARRRDALARERRARRIAPLLITAGGTGVILVARPRILDAARRLWDLARRQSGGKRSNVASEPQRARDTPRLAAPFARGCADAQSCAHRTRAQGPVGTSPGWRPRVGALAR